MATRQKAASAPPTGVKPTRTKTAGAKTAGAKTAGAKTASATPLTEAYIAQGDWNPLWDAVRALDPEFVEAYLAFRSVPHRKGPLPPKFKELVLVAINVATTHLYAPGARRHMQNALRLGATAEEILEVIQLTTVMGIHSVNMAVPMLVEELAKVAPPAPAPRKGRAR